jgi:hypothetical protein
LKKDISANIGGDLKMVKKKGEKMWIVGKDVFGEKEVLINMDNIVKIRVNGAGDFWRVEGDIAVEDSVGGGLETIILYTGTKEECELFFESLKEKVFKC